MSLLRGLAGEYTETLYHLCNFAVNLKLFQNKMLIFLKKKVAGSLLPGLAVLRKKNEGGCQGGERARAQGEMHLDLHPGGNHACWLKSLTGAQGAGQALGY